MTEFKIGDRVMAKRDVIEGYDVGAGNCGVVLHIITADRLQPTVGVAWERAMNGHNLEGRCQYGYGLWCFSPNVQLELLEEVTIGDLSGVGDLL